MSGGDDQFRRLFGEAAAVMPVPPLWTRPVADTATLAKVRQVIDAVVRPHPDDLKDSATLAGDLRLDSLDLVELGMELEGAFGLEVGALDDCIDTATTVAGLASRIDARRQPSRKPGEPT